MSRTRRAVVAAMFGYVRYGVAIVSGLVLVPMTLHAIGARTWGMWLASSEVLAYAGMVDLGVLSVLPLMLAEADGRRDRGELAELVSDGVWLGALVGIIYVGVSLAFWRLLPSFLFLSAADRAVIGPPLAALVLLSAITFPLGVYRQLVVGTQDVFFNGVLTLGVALFGTIVTVVLLLKGAGLWALVWGTQLPSVIAAIACVARAAIIAPDLVRNLSRPHVMRVRSLLVNGFGAWLSDLGWQILAASNGIVITYIGHPEWVPVYSCTAKLSSMCMQISWLLPDSGHVGLAQLHGERRASPKVSSVVLAMQRVHLLSAGAVACGLLAFNPAFVTRWVGASLFGGAGLNALLGFGVLVHSFTHGLITSAAVIGNRPRVGVLVFVTGIGQTLLAIFLCHRLGLNGVAWASVIAAAFAILPGAIVLLQPVAAISARHLVTDLVIPWTVRAAPLLAVASLAGLYHDALGLWVSAGAAATVCVAYMWQMRPLVAAIPVDAAWERWLVRLRVVSARPEPLTT